MHDLLQVFWLLVFRSSDLQIFRSPGLLVFRPSGLLWVLSGDQGSPTQPFIIETSAKAADSASGRCLTPTGRLSLRGG